MGTALPLSGERVRFVRWRCRKVHARDYEPKALAARSPSRTTATTLELTSALPEPLIRRIGGPGDRASWLADSTVRLLVDAAWNKESAACAARFWQAGLIRGDKASTMPGVKLSVAAMSDLDRRERPSGPPENEIDFVGLEASSRQRGRWPRELKALLKASVRYPRSGGPNVIAKIEKPEALGTTSRRSVASGRLASSMVARATIWAWRSTSPRWRVAQKRIISECRRQRKPVIMRHADAIDSMPAARGFPRGRKWR